MNSVHWQQLQDLFHQAADLPISERRAFLQRECAEDPDLLEEVLAMLKEDARYSPVLDGGLEHAANEVFAAAQPSWVEQQNFGPYRVKALLGEGGMGVVYLAERRDLGNPVAIKLLRDALLSPARRERFAQEQHTLAQLNHPLIARLYDADTLADGTPYFVMEYVEGVPLTEHCRKHASSLEDRLKLFRLVCEAVRYAHAQAVIHRDLKPTNVLVNGEGVVKLLDFGISKQLHPGTAADQTRTGLRLMTPAYAAPEQLRGDRIGTATDVYSLGVVLYELLTGRLPFDLSTRTPGEAEMIILQQDPQRPSVAAREVDPRAAARIGKSSWSDLDVLCLVAMRKDPERRYASVEALIRDVDHFLNAEPLEAQPDRLSYRLGKFLKRNQRPVLALAGALALIIGLTVFFTIRLAKARDAAISQAARSQRIRMFLSDLFTGGEAELGPSPNSTVQALVDKGLEKAKTLNRDPDVQSDLFDTFGTIYQAYDQLGKADDLLHRALRERMARLGPDHPEVINTLLEIGALRMHQGRYNEAEKLFNEGMAKSRFRADSSQQSKCLLLLGQVLTEEGKYRQAIAALQTGTDLAAHHKELESSFYDGLTLLANDHFYLGDYPASDVLNRQVLPHDVKVHGDVHPDVAADLVNLGNIQQELENYVQAEAYLRRALGIYESWYGKDHSEAARIMAALSRTLVLEGKLDEAAALINQALPILERVHGPMHAHVASALSARGKLSLRRGNLAEAGSDFARMLAIYRSVYGDTHYTVAVALSDLAQVRLAQNDLGTAEQLYRDANERFSSVFTGGHPKTAHAQLGLGKTLLLEKRYVEAEKYLLSGYGTLMKLGNPSMPTLQEARRELARVYEALGKRSEAAKFQAVRAAL